MNRNTLLDHLPSPTPAPLAPAGRILYVEDEESIRRLCGFYLRRAGFAVNEAGDGEAGWEALQRQTYDLVITDLRMPRLNGLALVQRMQTAGLRVPVLLASASPAAEADGNDHSGIVVAILQKPFTGSDLVRVVVDILSAQRRRVSPSGTSSTVGKPTSPRLPLELAHGTRPDGRPSRIARAQ